MAKRGLRPNQPRQINDLEKYFRKNSEITLRTDELGLTVQGNPFIKAQDFNAKTRSPSAAKPQPKKFDHGFHGFDGRESRLFLSVASVKSVVKNIAKNEDFFE